MRHYSKILGQRAWNVLWGPIERFITVGGGLVGILVVFNQQLIDSLVDAYQGIPWWVGLVILGGLLLQAFFRAGYKLWQDAEKERKDAEREREELRQENEELIAESEAKSSALSASWEEWAEMPLTPVEGKTFRNERVLLDGFHYADCTFINPTFVYNGEKPFRMRHPTIEGSINLEARTPPLQGLLQILRGTPRGNQVRI